MPSAIDAAVYLQPTQQVSQNEVSRGEETNDVRHDIADVDDEGSSRGEDGCSAAHPSIPLSPSAEQGAMARLQAIASAAATLIGGEHVQDAESPTRTVSIGGSPLRKRTLAATPHSTSERQLRNVRRTRASPTAAEEDRASECISNERRRDTTGECITDERGRDTNGGGDVESRFTISSD